MTLASEMLTREQETKVVLPQTAAFIVLRFDGSNFRSYTRGLDLPEDVQFMADMDDAAMTLAAQFNAVGAYVASDEVSIVLRPGRDAGPKSRSEYLFGGNLTKLTTIGAGVLSAALTAARPYSGLAVFDGRGFAVESADVVRQYLLSRQRSVYKNAVGMTVDSLIPGGKKKAIGVPTEGRVALLQEHGITLADEVSEGFLYGRIVATTFRSEVVRYTNKKTGVEHVETVRRKGRTILPAPRVPSAFDGADFKVGGYFGSDTTEED